MAVSFPHLIHHYSLSSCRAILVTGATGRQCGAVINALVAKLPSDFLLLAVTRNAQSASAKRLAAKSPNAKLVEGDFESIPSLFQSAKKVAGTVGVQHFVYSSVDRGGEGPSFAMKVFLTLLRDTMKNKPTQWISTEDIGYFAAEAFSDPTTWNKRAIGLTGDESNFSQLSQSFERATGSPAPTKIGLLGKALKHGVPEMGGMVSWWYDDGYSANVAETRRIHPNATTMEAYLKRSAYVIQTK
ncbi:hypothetical protein BKA60DRAFT_600047 [Fusarium oxysporum]|nr:hypothetical protein BKA60DRAFT_600047 [Fusarium oxysporum]